MAMVVKNNMSALGALNTLNTNTTALQEQLRKGWITPSREEVAHLLEIREGKIKERRKLQMSLLARGMREAIKNGLGKEAVSILRLRAHYKWRLTPGSDLREEGGEIKGSLWFVHGDGRRDLFMAL